MDTISQTLTKSIHDLLHYNSLRYAYGSRPLHFAVSTRLYNAALDVAPLGEYANSQFFLPITNGRIAPSTRLLSM